MTLGPSTIMERGGVQNRVYEKAIERCCDSPSLLFIVVVSTPDKIPSNTIYT